jgi:hypothetical protein
MAAVLSTIQTVQLENTVSHGPTVGTSSPEKGGLLDQPEQSPTPAHTAQAATDISPFTVGRLAPWLSMTSSNHTELIIPLLLLR